MNNQPIVYVIIVTTEFQCGLIAIKDERLGCGMHAWFAGVVCVFRSAARFLKDGDLFGHVEAVPN
eukprot:CAMPEP_0197716798 /NCGR_PEP_ID=MMETSP1434-20131217/1565_1 /TAXON_ID=265543 /ORGANISM="Minutocellus polymorphus, Strain CCMP3303" /LENGTH=64 /DNA_ID=CAMNT_0043301231 /DNA_START=686 /DNA_END=880 /DNA_ORIENTATION=+